MWARPWRSCPAATSASRAAEDRPGVDPRRRQQDLAERRHRLVRLGRRAHRVAAGVAERPAQPRLVRLGEVEVPLGQQRADEREAVRVEPGRAEADDRVAGPDGRAIDDPRALDDADRSTRRGRTRRRPSGRGARPSRRRRARSPPRDSRPRPRRRARRRPSDRAGRPRCSRGRRAARRRCRRRRRRTSRRGRCRSCRTARRRRRSRSWSRRRRSRRSSSGSR